MIRRTKESAIIEAKQYNTRQQMKKNANSLYQYLFKHKMLDIACGHMKCGKRKYTNEELIEDALKYSSRNEWQDNSKNKYQSAVRIGKDLLDKCCGHMDILLRPLADEYLHEIAKQFNYRVDFELGDNSAYRAANRRGVLDKICSHMGKNRPEIIDKNILYYISIDNGTYYKIGITSSNVKLRFRREKQSRIKIIFEKEFSNGYLAKMEELAVITKYKKYVVKHKVLQDGNTEIFTFDVLGLDIKP